MTIAIQQLEQLVRNIEDEDTRILVQALFEHITDLSDRLDALNDGLGEDGLVKGQKIQHMRCPICRTGWMVMVYAQWVQEELLVLHYVCLRCEYRETEPFD